MVELIKTSEVRTRVSVEVLIEEVENIRSPITKAKEILIVNKQKQTLGKTEKSKTDLFVEEVDRYDELEAADKLYFMDKKR